MQPVIKRNVSLKAYNTFGIEAKADYFAEVSHVNELEELLRQFDFKTTPLLILGGGSNMLFIDDFKGLVLKNNLQGIEIVFEDEHNLRVKAGGGVVWHELVLWSVSKNLGGIENLSLIPGSTGASPIQNIGAYGVELKDSFYDLEVTEILTGNTKTFSHADCNFGYRNSVFKNELKGKYIITSVTLQLKKQPVFNTSYGAIEQELKKNNIDKPSVKAISDAVIAIRKSKLPDPAVLGNAGSFFKNPEISQQQFEELQKAHPVIPHYPAAHGNIKLAAGWLIEQCGWKGKRMGNTGSHKDQALVLVNYGGAKGNEVYQLALDISKSVKEKFGVDIQPEVNLIK